MRSHRQEWKFVFVRDFDIGGEKISARKKHAHVAVQVCGMNAHGNGVLDLRADLALGFFGLDVLHGRAVSGHRYPSGSSRLGTLSFEATEPQR